MAPLTRLELRRAAAEPVLLRLLCSLSSLSSSFLALPSPFLPSTTHSFEFEVRGSIVLLDFQIPISVVAPLLEYEVLVGFKSLFLSPSLFRLHFFHARIFFYYVNRIKRNALHKPSILCSSVKSALKKNKS